MTMASEAEKVLTELVLMRSQEADPMGPIVDYVSKRMNGLGMDVRRHGSAEKPSLVGEWKKGGVVLSGHLDTVPIGTGWTKEQGEVVGGVMYGRGTNDMKGGCASMLLAAERLVAADVPFALCFTTDEETSMDGAAAASKDPALRAAPAVVVTEATEFDIVVKEKGLVQFSITTKGKPAHASMPHLGDNAIARMVSVLKRLEDVYRPPKDHLGQMTLCVDTIRGGTAMNVIPDECVAEVDVRYPPHMSTKAVLDLVREKVGDARFEVRVLHELDPVETKADIDAVRVMREVVGAGAKVLAVPYATEMVMFKSANKRLMVCGPGESAGCHIPDERIRVADVAKGAEIYTEYCSRMAGG
jgi:acetylornithine deacetylase/succinyl-diaminopimelate desuccinylase-like protein